MNTGTPLPGDTVLEAGSAWAPMSVLIRHAQAGCAEGYSDFEAGWTHAAIVEAWPLVIEARGLGVRRAQFAPGARRYVVLRHPCVVSDRDRARIVAGAAACIGDSYGWAEVVYMWLRHWFHFMARRKYDTPAQEFCSELCGLAYAHAGLPYPTELSPSCLWPAEIARMWVQGRLRLVCDTGDMRKTVCSKPFCTKPFAANGFTPRAATV